jgi:uncharacterized protein
MLAHTELSSTDPEATRKFLEKVFRWSTDSVQAPSGTIIRYTTPGGAGGSIRKAGPKESPAAINYILVEDIESTAKMVKEGGGEVMMPIADVPHMGKFFWFKVPGGPVLAAWQDAEDREA